MAFDFLNLILTSLINHLAGCFPAKVHLFFNEFSIDFDQAEASNPIQTFTFNRDHYKENKLVILDPYKWQNVCFIII